MICQSFIFSILDIRHCAQSKYQKSDVSLIIPVKFFLWFQNPRAVNSPCWVAVLSKIFIFVFSINTWTNCRSCFFHFEWMKWENLWVIPISTYSFSKLSFLFHNSRYYIWRKICDLKFHQHFQQLSMWIWKGNTVW